MPTEIVLSRESEETDLDRVPDQLPDVHPYVDPALALPPHLQAIPFEDDVWRRMSNSKLRHPDLTMRALRENAEQRDLLRGALAAASEREKEVLLHGQARVFTQMLYSAARSVRDFLNEPLVPASWKTPAALRASTKPGSKGAEEKGEKDEKADKSGFQGLLLYLLTPKVFLSIIALGFGVLAGYSQIQVRNLSTTIDTYEQALTSLKANNEVLDRRIAAFDEISEENQQKLNRQLDELAEVEEVNVKLRTEASGLNQKILNLEQDVKELKRELALAQEGKESTTADLQQKVSKANTELSTVREKAARQEVELRQLREFLEAQGTVTETATGERNKMAGELLELKTELALKDVELSNARQKGTLLGFAERALKDLKFLADRYSSIRDEHVLEHVEKYEARKDRFLR